MLIRDTGWLFHPGEYLEDEIDARGWTTRDVAILATDDPNEQQVIQLTCELTIAASYVEVGDKAAECTMGKSTARSLAKAFGTSVDLWLNLDAEFHRRRVAYLQN